MSDRNDIHENPSAVPNGEGHALHKTGWIRRAWRTYVSAVRATLSKDEKGEAHLQTVVFTRNMRLGNLFRFGLVFLLSAICFLLLINHIAEIQLRNSGKYQFEARGRYQKTQNIVAQRGTIRDCSGILYVGNRVTNDICVEPKRLQNADPKLDKTAVVIEILARRLGANREVLRKRFERAAAREFSVTIAKDVPAAFVREHALSSIRGLRARPVRFVGGAVESFHISFVPASLTPAERAISIDRILETFPELSRIALRSKCRKALECCAEICVQNGVALETVKQIREDLAKNDVKRGFRYLPSWVRDYPRNYELANLLGYTDDQKNGVSGVEAMMDAFLQPTPGKRVQMQDRFGSPVEDGWRTVEEASDGADVYLTIQEPIQRILEEELAELWEKNHPDRAYAVMMDPATGAILGLAQYPHFNPNDRETMRDAAATQNHIILQSYDPGSIMKAISLSGVLASGVATLDSVVDCEKGRWLYARKILRDSHPFEDLTLAEVIQHSSNIGTAKFSLELGEDRMYEHLRRFRFGRPTGLGFYPEGGTPVVFRQEAAGLFRERHQWDSLTITRVPMGQGITIPLLQILQAWSALANHGRIMQPYLIDRIQYANGTSEHTRPHVKAQAIPPFAAHDMTTALVQVMQKGGTGQNVALKGYSIAGKTGTAQMWIPPDKEKGIKGHYAEKQFLASFIGFAPADAPRFLLLVSAENPTTGYHTGAGVSGPVFKKIAARTLEYMQVPPDNERKEPPSPAATAALER